MSPPSLARRAKSTLAAGLLSVFAANEREPLYRDADHHPVGTIVAANDSLLVEANFSEPLTAYATGWRDPSDLQGALDFVAPVIPVGRRFEFAQARNAEEFFSEVDDVRAMGADFKRVEYTSAKALGITLNKGLTLRVDRDQIQNNPQWQQQAVDRLMRRLLRNEYRRAITILTARRHADGKDLGRHHRAGSRSGRAHRHDRRPRQQRHQRQPRVVLRHELEQARPRVPLAGQPGGHAPARAP